MADTFKYYISLGHLKKNEMAQTNDFKLSTHIPKTHKHICI